MSFTASRMDRIEPSASSVATQRARELSAQGHDIITLTQGQPDFPTPDHVIEAAHAAMKRGETSYTFVGGTPELRDAIAGKFARENGLAYAPEQIIASNGAKQIVFNALMASVEPGDEVIVTAPYWVSYPDMTKFAEGVPVVLECRQEDSFKLTPEQLDAAITEKTRWLILNVPNNPSGAVYSADELQALADVLERHPRVLVMTDDIYEHILFDGRDFATPAAVAPHLYERTLTVNGVSKAYAMTGWRIGYAGGPADLIKSMNKLQNQSTGNPCSISQAATVAALNGPQDFIAERTAQFQARRDRVVEMLSDVPGVDCHKPEGAFYVYPNCAGLIGRTTPGGETINDDRDLVLYFMEHAGVAAVHGGAYGLSPHFRLSTATDMESLEEACRRIQGACQALR